MNYLVELNSGVSSQFKHSGNTTGWPTQPFWACDHKRPCYSAFISGWVNLLLQLYQLPLSPFLSLICTVASTTKIQSEAQHSNQITWKTFQLFRNQFLLISLMCHQHHQWNELVCLKQNCVHSLPFVFSPTLQFHKAREKKKEEWREDGWVVGWGGGMSMWLERECNCSGLWYIHTGYSHANPQPQTHTNRQTNTHTDTRTIPHSNKLLSFWPNQ